MHSATLCTHMGNNTQHATEIKATSRIENAHEYQLRLAAWGQACAKAVAEVVVEYMYATIVLTRCEYETAPTEHRLRTIPFHV